MTDFKIGDRVRYTNARHRRIGEGSTFADYVGREGRVTSTVSGGHVSVTWDDASTAIGYPFIDNLELIPPVGREYDEPNFATEEELFGILSLVKAFNDTLTNGAINGSVSVGNTALYDSNGDVLGYIVYNADNKAWVFYDPSFKNEV